MREIRVSYCGGGAWESNPPNPAPAESQLDLKSRLATRPDSPPLDRDFIRNPWASNPKSANRSSSPSKINAKAQGRKGAKNQITRAPLRLLLFSKQIRLFSAKAGEKNQQNSYAP